MSNPWDDMADQLCGVINTSCVGLFEKEDEQRIFVEEYADAIAKQKYLAFQPGAGEIHYINIRHLGATIKTELVSRRIALGKREIEIIERVFKGIVGTVTLTVARSMLSKFLDKLAEKLEQHRYTKEDDIMAKIEVEAFVANIRPVADEVMRRYTDDNNLSISDWYWITTKAAEPLMRVAASVKNATNEEKMAFCKEAMKWVYHEVDRQKPGDGVLNIPFISGEIEVMTENWLLDDILPSLMDMLYKKIKPDLDEIADSIEE